MQSNIGLIFKFLYCRLGANFISLFILWLFCCGQDLDIFNIWPNSSSMASHFPLRLNHLFTEWQMDNTAAFLERTESREFSLKYCDNSIKIESPSNVGYETDRNSAKGRQFVVTITRKQNFFDKKKLQNILQKYHCYISILDGFPMKIVFWMHIIQILL